MEEGWISESEVIVAASFVVVISPVVPVFGADQDVTIDLTGL
jgi:hypothetical protein